MKPFISIHFNKNTKNYFCKFPFKQKSILSIGIALVCIGSLASAQLTYRIDANSNSYALQTPNSQTQFTQYFNGNGQGSSAEEQGAARLQQASQNQQQVCQNYMFLYSRKYK